MSVRIQISKSNNAVEKPGWILWLECHVSCWASCLMFVPLLPLLHPAALPPPTPPAEDVDRHRRRFNMRMLVPGRPVKETPPATPPPIPVERPTYKEKFIPPELSMWDYFVAKVRLLWLLGAFPVGEALGSAFWRQVKRSCLPYVDPPSCSPSYLPRTVEPCTTRTRAGRVTMTTMTMPSSPTHR